MTVSATSRNHYKTYDAVDWYDIIRSVMRDGEAWCIADMKDAIQARVTWAVEKSTVSARMNELASFKEIELLPKTMRSRATGIISKHYKITVQPPLL